MMKRIFLSLVLVFSFVPLSFAKETPEQIVGMYLDEINLKGFASVAHYYHPDELKKFKVAFMECFETVNDPEMIMESFGQAYSLNELKSMSDEVFVSKILQRTNDSFKENNVKFQKTEIIGSVAEKEDIHFLIRQYISLEDVDFNAKEIATLKPYKNTYKMLFNDELNMMIQAIQTRKESAE